MKKIDFYSLSEVININCIMISHSMYMLKYLMTHITNDFNMKAQESYINSDYIYRPKSLMLLYMF